MVAEVVSRPAGVVHGSVILPGIVQYKNKIDPSVPVVGKVKVNRWFTTPLGFEPPSVAPAWSVRLREVICEALALPAIKACSTNPHTNSTTVAIPKILRRCTIIFFLALCFYSLIHHDTGNVLSMQVDSSISVKKR